MKALNGEPDDGQPRPGIGTSPLMSAVTVVLAIVEVPTREALGPAAKMPETRRN
jgi:hypothetical protein